MIATDPSQPAPRVGPASGAHASGAAQRGAAADIGRHAQQAWSAVCDRVEQSRLAAWSSLMRALVAAGAMAAAIAIAWAGVMRLIGGAAEGLAQRLGSAWQADLTVGASCLLVAAAVFAGVAARARAGRRTRRPADPAGRPAATPAGEAIDKRGSPDVSPGAADRRLADAFAALRDDAARALDVRAHIARHPVAATASAFAIGVAAALAACERRRPATPTVDEPVASRSTAGTGGAPTRGWLEILLEDVLVPIAARCLSEATTRADEPSADRSADAAMRSDRAGA